MDIDNLTIKEAREIAALFAGIAAKDSPSCVSGDGRYVIVRARDAGVHFGKLDSYEGRTVRLTHSRRMWRWKAASGISLSDCATAGIATPDSKICATVSHITILDACEIIDCSQEAAQSFLKAAVYQP